MKDFLKSFEQGKEPIQYDNKMLLMAILNISALNLIYTEHIIKELYPKAKERRKIIKTLVEDGTKLYWQYLTKVASLTDQDDG